MMNTAIDKIKSSSPLFWVVVIIPTALAILYYGFFASDVYISESKFVVRRPDRPSTVGLGTLLSGSGFSSAGDEIYAAQSYVLSRDALQALNQDRAFSKAYGATSISVFDRYNASGLNGSFEELYKYYKEKITVEHDTASSIVTLRVRAYTAESAHHFNERLLEMAEATVNKLNTRGRQDMIRFAQAEVDEANKMAQDAALALANYRDRERVVDPERQAEIQLQMISKLQDELISAETQLRELRAFAPQNPQVEALEARVAGISDEIAKQTSLVAGADGSLSSMGVRYQRLVLNNQFAEKQLASVLISLEEARSDARRKQAYVERIVEPNTPDEALEPRRLRGVFSTLLLGLAAWGILSMLLAGMREHRD